MPCTSVVRRVPHSWEELYSLVLEVESYPRFVPFCHAIDVLDQSKRDGADEVTARMEVGFAAFRERFTSRILGRRASQEILISNVDGPFRSFDGADGCSHQPVTARPISALRLTISSAIPSCLPS